MRKIILLLIFVNLLFGKAKWIAYKETLFIGEPIIPILCYKNDTPSPKEVEDIPPTIFSFYTICNGNKYVIPQSIFELLTKIDTITIFPGESVYIIEAPFFYSDFCLIKPKAGINYNTRLPFKYGKFTIYIPSRFFEEGTDSIILYFKEPPKGKEEFFEFIKHLSYWSGEEENDPNSPKLKELAEKYKDTLLLTFIFRNYVNNVPYTKVEGEKIKWRDLKEVYSEKEKRLIKMKKIFPNHIFTEELEFDICMGYLFAQPNKGYELYKELKKKYPYNYYIKRIENRIKELKRK
ncbi:MAG: hypothetical protein ABIK60_03740 [candidate division WOR-3 bacterium]